MNMSKTTRPMAGPCANRLRHNQLMIRGQKGLRLHRFPKDLLESPGKIWRPLRKSSTIFRFRGRSCTRFYFTGVPRLFFELCPCFIAGM